ncbi:DIS3-like exonuclease 2 [Seminavis robusta]|uniref:DIS3-like exonuclease 2 n=1 Tax=Seminavis robusta TaxID=568900 RepID=A0A9N8HJD1_9STRA|nr:DIS3-like exonuclease 2 [Seminavis robusta]|eukprot:Sro545_g163880.1 DIS3-like exonuclease 2 (930) ;mRNA; f:32853-35813
MMNNEPTATTPAEAAASAEGQKNPPKKNRARRKKRGGGGRKDTKETAENEQPNVLSEAAAKSTGNNNKDGGGNNNKKNRRRKGKGGNNNNNNNNSRKNEQYPPYWPHDKCLKLYVDQDPNMIRGKLRCLPSKDGMAFCACDRGSQKRDILIESALERNRAMNGDTVFIELLPEEDDQDSNHQSGTDDGVEELNQKLQHLSTQKEENNSNEEAEMWQDDAVQMKLWNPVVPVKRIKRLEQATITGEELAKHTTQRKGRVVCVCTPPIPKDSPKQTKPRRIMIGTLKSLQSGTCLFTPNDRTLPQFKCDNTQIRNELTNNKGDSSDLYRAEYVYHAWKENHNWPPCVNVKRLGEAHSIEDQIQGLLMENHVDHGEFTPQVLKDVEDAVQSGVYVMNPNSPAAELGWKPTPEMLKGRRDYRNERIFTIDPTTAKDLDDALHIKELPDGRIELGVHIADVSAFVTPGSNVDDEAARRTTTVYLVDRTVPMLPRPLCEVACSLNENVERLAFSCVWTMQPDGNLAGSSRSSNRQDVWYGRTVIKSCARLDYGTAQNIIDKKVANGESESEMDEELWPKSRRPTGGHTVDQVAANVRLMHRVAMARRRLRFANGALALHGVKLTFRLDDDGKTPLACTPYPIKDSNRLVEEYMLLANYLVAQRLITHAGDRAVLRRHPDPLPDGLNKVVDIAKAMFDFNVDASSSATLHDSLVRLGRICNDEVFLKCMTQMLTTPMQNADYFAAGAFEKELWRHFALNIPFYTHFTSPIRRYADVLVHRLLQATIDGEDAVDRFPLNAEELHGKCEHCNDKRLASKMAQERCDVIFLALYLRSHPIKSVLGVVLSLGNKAFTVFVPSLGVNAMVFLEEHKDWLEYENQGDDHDHRIVLTRKAPTRELWNRMYVKMFTKVLVSCLYKDKPRVDVKLQLEGPAPKDS